VNADQNSTGDGPGGDTNAERAREYIENGWQCIPIPRGEKNPNRRGWQNERIEAEDVAKHWTNGQNIGVLTGEKSDWIVDVDLDQPEALRVAPYILPETRTSGRESCKDSHRWYRATSPVKSQEWNVEMADGEPRPMVELRAGKRQTLLPPSVHPCGEQYVWCNRLPVLRLTGEEIARKAENVAVAGLLLKRYPRAGSRHAFVLAASGFLVRHLGSERTEKIMQAVVYASGDEETPSRLGDIADTIQRYEKGGPTTGGTRLEALAEGVVERMRKWGLLKESKAGKGPGGDRRARPGARVGGGKDEPPTHDELRDRWTESNPDYAHGLGEWRRYEGGIWPTVKDAVVRRDMVRTLEHAKAEGIKPSVFVLNSVHELARLDCYVEDERWDGNRDVIVAENGAVDIPTGELLPHNPEHYATTRVPYSYDPGAYAVRWGYFLETTVDDNVAGFLQEFAGYCLTTDTSYEKALWLIGPPGGGKSTFIEGLTATLGVRAGVLGLAEIEKSRFSLAKLAGKTLVTAAEQPAGFVTCHPIINAIVSGEPIQVERKYRDPYDLTPRAKIAWAMNELPRMPKGAEGLFRRVEVIRFPEIAEEDRDPKLKEDIKGEGAGILNWALEGLRRLRGRGRFDVPEIIQRATEEFRETNDIPALFVEERCNKGEHLQVKSSELYSEYKHWCELTGHKPQSSTTIAEDWRRLGFEKVSKRTGNFWQGVDLNPHDTWRSPVG
jgi:putative DNA primase/helicase